MLRKFFKWIGLLDDYTSVAEVVGRLLSLLLVGGGGTVSGYLAKTAPIFHALGDFTWALVGIISALLIAIVLYFLQLANRQSKYADYIQAMALTKSEINPLSDSFKDQIIPVEQLRLPMIQVHERKHFRRCKFVGPGTLAIMGGTWVHSSFYEIGDMIPVPPNTTVTGVIVLKECTVEQCEFYRTTILAPQQVIDGFNAQTSSAPAHGNR